MGRRKGGGLGGGPWQCRNSLTPLYLSPSWTFNSGHPKLQNVTPGGDKDSKSTPFLLGLWLSQHLKFLGSHQNGALCSRASLHGGVAQRSQLILLSPLVLHRGTSVQFRKGSGTHLLKILSESANVEAGDSRRA